jgi:hypothetical protein
VRRATRKQGEIIRPDGTSYPGTVTLAIPKQKIEVRITKANYQKLA